MKKKEILATAAVLAGELSTVCEGSRVKRASGETIDVTPYAHGAAVALGLLALYAEGGRERPTARQVMSSAIDWHENLARLVAEHPEMVTSETIDLGEGEGDHE